MIVTNESANCVFFFKLFTLDYYFCYFNWYH